MEKELHSSACSCAGRGLMRSRVGGGTSLTCSSRHHVDIDPLSHGLGRRGRSSWLSPGVCFSATVYARGRAVAMAGRGSEVPNYPQRDVSNWPGPVWSSPSGTVRLVRPICFISRGSVRLVQSVWFIQSGSISLAQSV